MTRRHSDLALYGRLGKQARPCLPHLAGLLVLSLLSAALKLLTPVPLMICVDNILASRPLPASLERALGVTGLHGEAALLALAAGLVVVIALLIQLMGLATTLLSAYTGDLLVLSFRAALFGHAQRLSLSYHDSRGTTDSAYRIQYDAPAIQWILVEALIPLFTAGLTVAAMVYVTMRIHVSLAVVALVVAPVLFVLTQAFGQRLRGRSKELKKLESSTLSVVQEVLAALRVVKAFGQEEREQDRFVSQSRQGLRARLRVIAMAGGLGLMVGLILALGTAAVLVLGVHYVQEGTLTLGELLLVMAYLAQLYAPLETISKKLADLQASLASAERAYDLLDEGPEVVEAPNALLLGRSTGVVAFREVSFAYPGGPPVLHAVSFAVPAGSRVGIAGRTGAGKTTLLSLLTRLHDPTTGQVVLDGVDVRNYRLADLRNQFAVVLQEPVLFSTSIAENIAYARPGAREEEIRAAAQSANAHEFISRLPQGYETPVGERGMQLSGGERQRISLARAFLKDAPVLILDEPTSSVDLKTEALIMEALERLMHGRTTFIIAHRLSTLDGCDVRLRLEHGRLVADGLSDIDAAGGPRLIAQGSANV
jgi:ATP-binding cassette subfamily B protein